MRIVTASPVVATILLAWVVTILVAPWFEATAIEVRLEHILTSPSSEFVFGTDELGRSVAARVALGARYSLSLSLFVVAVCFCIGTFIGVAAGWYGGAVDLALVRLIDLALAFPGILLAIALAGLLGPGLDRLAIALVAVGWVGFARVARAQTLSLKHSDHVTSSRALGTADSTIMVTHILPLIAAPLIVEATFALAAIIVAEAGLSFLGLGIQPPTPSWGSMIRDGSRFMLIAPHFVLVPGLALVSVVLAINLLGDSLREQWAAGSRG